jgi:hypothetical protein
MLADQLGNEKTAIVIEGIVIQVYEKGDKKIAKIKYDSGFAETTYNLSDEIHLGDTVRLKGEFTTKKREKILR